MVVLDKDLQVYLIFRQQQLLINSNFSGNEIMISYFCRSILLYFCVSGLDILGDIDDIPEERKNQMVDWLYSLQVVDDGRLACLSANGNIVQSKLDSFGSI